MHTENNESSLQTITENLHLVFGGKSSSDFLFQIFDKQVISLTSLLPEKKQDPSKTQD